MMLLGASDCCEAAISRGKCKSGEGEKKCRQRCVLVSVARDAGEEAGSPPDMPGNKSLAENYLPRKLFSQGSFEVDRDGCERFGYRAVLFGIFGELLESLFIDARNDAIGLQVDGSDGETSGYLIELDAGVGVDARGGETCAGKRVRECHRVATGVRCSDELLRVGAGRLVAHARFERVATREGSAPHTHGTLALPQVPLPLSLCCTCWHNYVSFSTLINYTSQ